MSLTVADFRRSTFGAQRRVVFIRELGQAFMPALVPAPPGSLVIVDAAGRQWVATPDAIALPLAKQLLDIVRPFDQAACRQALRN